MTICGIEESKIGYKNLDITSGALGGKPIWGSIV